MGTRIFALAWVGYCAAFLLLLTRLSRLGISAEVAQAAQEREGILSALLVFWLIAAGFGWSREQAGRGGVRGMLRGLALVGERLLWLVAGAVFVLYFRAHTTGGLPEVADFQTLFLLLRLAAYVVLLHGIYRIFPRFYLLILSLLLGAPLLLYWFTTEISLARTGSYAGSCALADFIPFMTFNPDAPAYLPLAALTGGAILLFFPSVGRDEQA